MTNQGALTTLNLMKSRYADLDMKRIRLACDIAMDAIKKQIPKKPIIEREDYPEINNFMETYICPICNSELAGRDQVGFTHRLHKYCDCGQALDWSDEE